MKAGTILLRDQEHIIALAPRLGWTRRGWTEIEQDTLLPLISMPSSHPSLARTVSGASPSAVVPFVESLAPGTVYAVTMNGTTELRVKLFDSLACTEDLRVVGAQELEPSPTTVSVLGSPVSA